MPITKTITETHKRTVTLLTLQEYADQTVAEQYRQPLKTIHEALAVHGWDADPFPEDYKPICCGSEVSIRSFLGGPYFVQCESCKKFLVDITGPQFGNSWVNLPDGEKIDLETDIEHRWIAGVGLQDKSDTRFTTPADKRGCMNDPQITTTNTATTAITYGPQFSSWFMNQLYELCRDHEWGCLLRHHIGGCTCRKD